MVEILPSVEFEPDNPRPLGFVSDVTSSHLHAVGEALAGVGEVVAEVTGEHEPTLRVRFSSVRYMPTMPFVLYSFHIARVDDAGQFSDEATDGQEITYALVANHAVEVQRESALLFLYDLVFRQEAMRQMMQQTDAPKIQIDALVAGAVRQARNEFRDRIHGGWLQGARSIAQRAVAADLPLAVRYEVDVLPTRQDVVGRMPHLRAAYNDIAIARDAIDKQVSMIGGRDPRISAPGLTQGDEDKVQRHIASLGLRQWISQTTRDALVCGNGYMVTAAEAEPTLYALRPETVEILGPDKFAVLRDGTRQSVTDHVLAVRGIEQFKSPYGISLLEPVLGQYRIRRIFTEATALAQRILATLPTDSNEGRWATQTLELAKRSLADSDEQLSQLLWYPRDWLEDAREGLYFPGQEQM
jgi:hypothetical protein